MIVNKIFSISIFTKPVKLSWESRRAGKDRQDKTNLGNNFF
jgi:hypothetical protein